MQGPNQEIAVEYGGINAMVKECQYIASDTPGEPEPESGSDDDDDFDEDDDDSTPKQKKLKLPPIAQLLCSFTGMANQKIQENIKDVSEAVRLSIMEHAGTAVNNTWYTPVANERSFIMLCSGIQFREPQFRFEDNKLVMSTKLDKNPLNISEYCDNRW